MIFTLSKQQGNEALSSPLFQTVMGLLNQIFANPATCHAVFIKTIEQFRRPGQVVDVSPAMLLSALVGAKVQIMCSSSATQVAKATLTGVGASRMPTILLMTSCIQCKLSDHIPRCVIFLLVKLLHALAIIFTPAFYRLNGVHVPDHCDVDPPIHLGPTLMVLPLARSALRGHAGYGLEEQLLGGRLHAFSDAYPYSQHLSLHVMDDRNRKAAVKVLSDADYDAFLRRISPRSIGWLITPRLAPSVPVGLQLPEHTGQFIADLFSSAPTVSTVADVSPLSNVQVLDVGVFLRQSRALAVSAADAPVSSSGQVEKSVGKENSSQPRPSAVAKGTAVPAPPPPHPVALKPVSERAGQSAGKQGSSQLPPSAVAKGTAVPAPEKEELKALSGQGASAVPTKSAAAAPAQEELKAVLGQEGRSADKQERSSPPQLSVVLSELQSGAARPAPQQVEQEELKTVSAKRPSAAPSEQPNKLSRPASPELYWFEED